MRKTSVLLWASVCSIGTLFVSCNNHKKQTTEKSHVLVTQPLVIDTTVSKQYVCQIRSIQHVEVRSLEKGYLEKIFVDEGQYVRKGQPLFQIMPNIYNAEFEKAKAELDATSIELQNTQSLADKNVVAPNELALAKAKVKRAKAELSLANTHLQFTKIVAPFSGFINHLLLKVGSVVDEGELITSISDNSVMWVYFNVPEAEYINFKTLDSSKQNSTVDLLMANQAQFNQKGKVETIEADFNNETGNIAFRAAFPNPDNLLRNGQTGNIIMHVPVGHAIVIPQKATFEILDKKYVFVVDSKHTVHLTPITVMAEMPDLFIVQSGLKGNEKIIYDGIKKVQDKDVVAYELRDIRDVMSALSLESE